MKITANRLEIFINGGYREFTEKQTVSALEKRIPKKGTIKYLSSYTDDPPVLLCPNCQEHIPTEGCNFYKYCYKCGQAIDWSADPTEKEMCINE